MSEEQPPEPAFSGIDLAQSFLPDWAKAGSAPASAARLAERFDRGDEAPRGGQRRDGRGPSNRRPDDRRPGGGRPAGPHGDQRNRPDRAGGPRGGGRRDEPRGSRDRRDDRPGDRRPEPPPMLPGWAISVLPDPRGVDGLIKQIRASAKAYPLFDLALLVLEKPERFRITLKRDSDQSPAIFQLATDGSLWLTEKEAVQHVMARHLEKFYRRERVAVDPPKGSFSCVAVCGDIVLGPPNHHAYQTRLREVHAARFRNFPFEVFKSRVQMVRDPEFIEKWKAEQSFRDEFFPAEVAEGCEPARFADLAAVEADFRANHAAGLISRVEGPLELSGTAFAGASSPSIRNLAHAAVNDLRRFPLPLAHILGQAFAAGGLQIFKAHENITYVSTARPKYLDRSVSPVAEGLSGILDHLESAPPAPRPDQWKALLALRSSGEDPGASESALASDLSWLIHQGHVMDYAKRGLEAVRKPRPQREPSPKKKNPAPVERGGQPPAALPPPVQELEGAGS